MDQSFLKRVQFERSGDTMSVGHDMKLLEILDYKDVVCLSKLNDKKLGLGTKDSGSFK